MRHSALWAQCDVQSVIPTIKLQSAHGRFEFYGRGDRNRTCDPLHPMQVLYQAEPHPEQCMDVNAVFEKLQSFFICRCCIFRKLYRQFVGLGRFDAQRAPRMGRSHVVIGPHDIQMQRHSICRKILIQSGR